jgi:vacuolar-type H+-ATPase subunit E/Vma4
MGTTDIANKILADAEAEAQANLGVAKERANAVVEEAQAKALKLLSSAKQQAQKRCADIAERKAASTRLECAKINLSEQHRIIDGVYQKALKKLVDLNAEDTLAWVGRLLEAYAEEGDVIYFAQNFLYAEKVMSLAVVAKKKLTSAKERVNLSGGFLLKGKDSDKDLSYAKLLADDKEENAGTVLRGLYK